jgi:hypothetical protein
MIGTLVRNPVRWLTLLGMLSGLTACTDIPGAAPGDIGVLPEFADDITLLSFQSEVAATASRVEVMLLGDGLVAREVAIKSGEVLGTAERIHGHITGFEPSDGGGILKLDIGDLRIAFNRETGITAQGTDGELELDTFIARVTAALAEQHYPAVVALRNPPDGPQAPDETEFVASRLKLGGEGEGRIIALNIDDDNLIRNDVPPPDGWLAVLGLRIELRVSEGITHIRKERDEVAVERFEGVIESVNIDRHSFTLRNGTVVRLVLETEIKYEVGDEHRLGSLEEVARAINAGHTVFAAGAGVVEGTEPLRLVAIAVVFEVAPLPLEDFEGVIKSVDLVDSTVTLGEGITIRITAETTIGCEADAANLLGSLEEVARALDEGQTVVAAGVGVVEENESLVIVARKIAFVLRRPPMEEFRGVVREVDLTDSIVALVEGPNVRVTAETDIWFELGDTERLGSLEEVAQAVAAGETVLAAGVGEVAPAEAFTIVARKIVFFLEPPDLTAFHGIVDSVDVVAHTFTLENGTVVRLGEETVVWFAEGDLQALRTLGAVAEALEDHQTVLAAGVGVVEGTDPFTLLARRVAFMVVPPGIQHFEGVIASVNREARSFTLEDGTTIRIVEGTMIAHESGGETLGTFESVADVVAAPGRVTAAGMGLLETSEPLVLIAIAVVFRL